MDDTVTPLEIALIAPLCESVPPRLYGGTERVVAILAEALVAQGHHVTLFASGDTKTTAKLVPGRSCALRLDPSPLRCDVAAHLSMLHYVRRRAGQFDVLHFHVDLLHFPFFEKMADRTLTTLHGRLDLGDLPDFYRRWPQFPLVSISDSQRRPLPFANWRATVRHGLPIRMFSPSTTHQGYLAFLGRISPEKRPDRAIEIARRACMRLLIAAKVDPADEAYFREKVRPMMMANPSVEYIGEIGDSDKQQLLGNAAALLFPVDWPEPFGLVMIEAMACGTPVIAWPNGAVPEVLEEGVTGFLVDSVEKAAEATGRIETIDRQRVRACFERRFSAEAMSKNYVRLYSEISGLARRRDDDVHYRRRQERAADRYRVLRA